MIAAASIAADGVLECTKLVPLFDRGPGEATDGDFLNGRAQFVQLTL